MKLTEPRSAVTALVLIAVAVFAGITSVAPVHAGSPTISNATVVSQATSLTLPSGGQLYIYALATDGSKSTNYFTNSLGYLYPPTSIDNVNGVLVAAVAVSTSNTNSYTTSTSSYTIAGASVSGFGRIPPPSVESPRPVTYTAISNAPGANGVSVYTGVTCPYGCKSIPAAGYLVVIVAIGGDEQCISSISGLPGFVIDASNSNSGSPAIIIGHTYAATAHYYVVTMASSQCAAGQNPNNAADLIEAFVFLPTTA